MKYMMLIQVQFFFRYIPENFYSDFTMADQTGVPDYLQTVVAGKTSTTTVSASASNINGTTSSINQQPSTIQLPISVAQQVSANQLSNQQPITIQLPTQPQPQRGVQTVTYVNPVISKATTQQQMSTVTTAANLQPLRVTQYAYTQSGNML